PAAPGVGAPPLPAACAAAAEEAVVARDFGVPPLPAGGVTAGGVAARAGVEAVEAVEAVGEADEVEEVEG
ncbi:hypothetical protein, partial [Streptomyces sp. CBMA123]|uniref:hypothetical protein n=1 Tax=Streptomyces sp. CBMA123 TaxID=1896313 RepID=UPI001CB82A37